MVLTFWWQLQFHLQRNETQRSHNYNVEWYEFCLIGLLLVFRCRYLLKILNYVSRWNKWKLWKTSLGYRQRLFLTNDLNEWVPMVGWGGGGGVLLISSEGGNWKIFWGLKFSISGFFWLRFHLRGDFLRTQNNLKLSFVYYWWNRGCSWVSLVFFGFCWKPLVYFWGVDFCPNSIIPSLEIRSTPLEKSVSKKELLNLK